MTAVPTLAPLEAAQLLALIDLWVDCWSLAMPQIDFEARRDWFARHLETLHTAGARTMIAWASDGRALLGFVTVDPAQSVLDQLCVAPRAQGSGVADQLMRCARTLCPSGLTLVVNEDNPRARRFYARQGFVQVGEGINELSGLRTLTLRWSPTRRP